MFVQFLLIAIIETIFCTPLSEYKTINHTEEALVFRKDYNLLRNYSNFYKTHKSKLSFSDAVATCKAEGSKLWLPKSKMEALDVIKSGIKQENVDSFWIGIHDIFSEGEFISLDGISSEELWIQWAPDEPNNANESQEENCVSMKRNIKNENNNDDEDDKDDEDEYDVAMYDEMCDLKKNFVCQRSIFNLSQNYECETYDAGYVFSSVFDNCYKFHSTPMKWREAFKVCRAELASLVIINSEAEAKFLVKEFAKRPVENISANLEKNAVHVGFNDLINHGVYLTVEGISLSETGYEEWAEGQPDNQDGNEHCGSTLRNGKLNDINCDARAYFVCEKTLSNPFKSPSYGLPDSK